MDREIEVVLWTLLVVAACGAIGLVGWLAKLQRIPPRWVRFLAFACAVGLVAMLATDWPFGDDENLWDDASVVSGVLSTVLLIGIGFLTYEYGELRDQERLDSSLTAAGVGGIVDHLVDVEVALALISADDPPDRNGWPGSVNATKPLRWLRQHRERLARDAPDRSQDPRTWAAVLPRTPDDEWRVDLVDQCIRRLLGAIRDWAPVINTSRNGTRVLIAISQLRNDLVLLGGQLRQPQPDTVNLLISLRQRARLLAHFLEDLSGADPHRPEVLDTFAPLQPSQAQLEWASTASGKDLFGTEWQQTLAKSERALRDG